ncbi:divergent polysaccharide deacetylase family protein [Erwinia pyrifoliae]|uniref:Divergent polysaccharide deacetylase family protein n=1 Tax=Erwinia pyrifoliae TaxID=79967 RepID=A0ABY5X8S0_ERWPY|nr:divergent polysaccharide deacetylase family protein [Erwinia pyrifoliae]MCT2385341.1 divergent polysaccharide deacetylase family protein [Erwinia pyrifoliae]MCU8585434.1 divergent polysaccharide deacetylase family protein [Erwinia pyrifoliae]UWS33742.1 divergent polysaccharide deacetylase family protein [Erwinia pyrifoliae]UXK12414.1 divergent polysaccharide deacetylase family protein [Erwinia pyrifoliae]
MQPLRKLGEALIAIAIASPAWAGKLSIVIDDFGYRPALEQQVLQMPAAISVAVLPNAPHAREMATKAHQSGHEVLIHLPMAPLSKQPLEKDTLRPDMPTEEIGRIIREAAAAVPYAVGLNNHMGSAMTSSLPAMQKVMQILNHYHFYFLDSMTIGNSQATRAAEGTNVKVVKRRVFLDDSQNEADIRVQFTRAVRLAQRDGSAIAIGHPHPSTVRVLQQMLPGLPADIILERPSQLLNATQPVKPAPLPAHPLKPRNPFRGGSVCPVKAVPVPATRALETITESIKHNQMVQETASKLSVKFHF